MKPPTAELESESALELVFRASGSAAAECNRQRYSGRARTPRGLTYRGEPADKTTPLQKYRLPAFDPFRSLPGSVTPPQRRVASSPASFYYRPRKHKPVRRTPLPPAPPPPV